MENPFEFDPLDYLFQLRGAGGIIGGGGGGKGGGANRSPIEQQAGTPSSAYAQVVELLSEGPCRGFRDEQDIFLENTPIKNADGTENFKGYALSQQNGFNNQGLLSGFSSFQGSEKSVGVEVSNVIPSTRSIINNQLDGVIVRFGLQLQRFEENGDINGNTMRYQIYIQEGSGPFTLRLDNTITERYPDTREFEHYFPINNQNGAIDRFAVRFTKVTPDSESSKVIQNLRWQSYTEVIDAQLTYPNSFVVGLQFSAEQFSSVPTRSYRIGGRMVAIPTNAVVDTNGTRNINKGYSGGLNFTGIWDGNLYIPSEPTSDVAWQVYDLLTNEVYGLGKTINPNQIAISDLYEISQYNNQVIKDGFGNVERRFRCCTYLQSKEEAFKYIQSMLSNCNAHLYWDGSQLRFWQDRPGIITHQFTNADVSDGSFTYSSTDIRSRNSIAYVTWNDPDDFFRQAVEPVELEEAVDIYGIRETEFTAYGCFSRGQAVRAGRYQLATNFYETETVNFRTRHLGVYCRPGDIIAVADSRRSLVQAGGLIMEARADSIKLDRSVPLRAGVLYSIQIKLPSGAVESRNIANPTGSYTSIETTIPFSEIPNPESNWIVDLVDTQLFRVLTMEATGEDLSGIEIIAAQYEPSKYDFIENEFSIQPRQIQSLAPVVAEPPINLLGTVSVTRSSTGIILSNTIICKWQPPPNSSEFVTAYIVEHKRGVLGSWRETKTVYSNQFEIIDALDDNFYYFRVACLLVNGKVSTWQTSAEIYIGYNGIGLNFEDPLDLLTLPLGLL
ncbi:MAG: hypothetical protein KME47_09335 [Nodosilinea sp. WJT8-NPBG4]|jgi:predicted phage tail protein|nr:hypothetical protein [Nodosilinea sp. WJT8-NPBG4]